MKEYILVFLIEKRPVGTILQEPIPLHVTFLHWFKTKEDVQKVIESTESVLLSLRSMTTIAGNQDLFGPNKDILVTRLSRTPDMLNMHVKLLKAVGRMDVGFDNRWVGESQWMPHVTHREGKRLNSGDVLNIRDIDLIMRPIGGHTRTIVERFKLGD